MRSVAGAPGAGTEEAKVTNFRFFSCIISSIIVCYAAHAPDKITEPCSRVHLYQQLELKIQLASILLAPDAQLQVALDKIVPWIEGAGCDTGIRETVR